MIILRTNLLTGQRFPPYHVCGSPISLRSLRPRALILHSRAHAQAPRRWLVIDTGIQHHRRAGGSRAWQVSGDGDCDRTDALLQTNPSAAVKRTNAKSRRGHGASTRTLGSAGGLEEQFVRCEQGGGGERMQRRLGQRSGTACSQDGCPGLPAGEWGQTSSSNMRACFRAFLPSPPHVSLLLLTSGHSWHSGQS